MKRPAPSRCVWLIPLLGLAGIGLAFGFAAFAYHLRVDPLVDVRAYYDAATRLNAGLPLYVQTATTNEAEFYRYPPLLAIVFRPLALLPYTMAALIWEVVVVGATVLTLLRLRPRMAALFAACILALPIALTIILGQAQALVTLFLAIGAPWSVALAGHIKLFPWLAAIYWVARRDVRALAHVIGWTVGLGLLQLVLAPADTITFLTFSNLEQVGQVNNFSPYALSPLLWAATVIAMVVVALLLGRGRFGWPAAIVLVVFATPRLLSYQLETLVAMFGDRFRDGPVVPGTAGRVPSATSPADDS